LKNNTPKAHTGRPTHAHAGSGGGSRGRLDPADAGARKRPARPDPLAAKEAAPRSNSVAGNAKRADRATDGDATAPRIRARVDCSCAGVAPVQRDSGSAIELGLIQDSKF